jgi:hypothetical protein
MVMQGVDNALATMMLENFVSSRKISAMSEQAWRLSHQSTPRKVIVSSEFVRLLFHSTTWEVLKTPEISQ